MAARKTTQRRSKPRRASAAPLIPTPGHGEQIWILDVPYRAPAPGAKYYKALKAHAYIGTQLPDELTVYASKPYSYARWVEEDFNGVRQPGATGFHKIPRPEQVDAAKAIATAFHHGKRGFLLADEPGVGKTGSAILGAKAALKLGGGDTVLITVDRPAQITIAAWRDALAAFGDGGYRWLIISPDQLKKLLGRNGQPKYSFSLIINDEAQQFRHLTAQRTQYQRRINRLAASPEKAPFVITVTATPGHHPGEYTYLSSLFAQLHDDPPGEWADLGKKLVEHGLPLAPGWDKGKWDWNDQAKGSQRLQHQAVTRVRKWMTDCDPPVMMHRDAPWGPPPIDGLPLDFTATQWAAYHQDWSEFRSAMRIARQGNDTARGRAALMRFRQKAGMLRAPQTAELVAAHVERGYQVLVAVELVTTAADPVANLLEEHGIGVSRIFGGGDLETERIRFQRGHNPVVVFNTASAINLQASELMVDGSRASSARRIGFFHQPRYSGIAARQTMGRAHRDGQVCSWSLLFAAGTVEEQAARIMINRLMVTSASVDGDLGAFGKLARLFDADWLPESIFE